MVLYNKLKYILNSIKSMSIISTENLVKHYNSSEGTIKALDGLNLEIPNGATALLGPNGSGKSTFIKIILGLLNATSDHIHYFLIKMISLQKMICKTLDICLKPQASFLRLMQLNMLDILVSYPDYHLQEQCKEHMKYWIM